MKQYENLEKIRGSNPWNFRDCNRQIVVAIHLHYDRDNSHHGCDIDVVERHWRIRPLD